MTESRPEFGVALIERGSEVGGGDERTSVGTAARIAGSTRSTAGGSRSSRSGTRRLSVLEWLPDDPYPIADVEDWPDTTVEDPGSSGAVDSLTERVEEIRRLAVEVPSIEPEAAVRPSTPRKLSDDVVMATYQLAARAPIGPADRIDCSAAPSVAVRLDTFAEVLDDVEAMLRFRLA